MKAALLSEVFPPMVGGSGRWLWELYRRLPPDRVRILAGEAEGHETFDATHQLALSRVPLTFSTWLIRRSSFGQYRRAGAALLRALEPGEISMVHCGKVLPEGLLARWARLRTGVPYACYAHGEEVNLSNRRQRPPWPARRVFDSRELGQMVGLVLRGATLVIANSRNTRGILIDRWRLPEERVRLLNPGVDTRQFAPAERRPAVRARLGWSDRPVILTVGRLQRRKGQDTMIRALRAVRDLVPDVLYAIVGAGEEHRRLVELAHEQGLASAVSFLGEVTDRQLVECYQQCDLFVLPNREIDGDIEGFGMVLLEAQACGRPVIAGRSGGTAEAMRDGISGRLVACEEPDALAAAVGELLADEALRREMGDRGRDWVTREFDWEVVCRKAADILELGEAVPADRDSRSPRPRGS